MLINATHFLRNHPLRISCIDIRGSWGVLLTKSLSDDGPFPEIVLNEPSCSNLLRLINKEWDRFFLSQMFYCSSSMFTWSFWKYSHLGECTSNSVAAILRTHDAGHSLLGPWESPHFSSAPSEVSNRMPWSFVFSDGNKKKSQGARLGL